MIITLVLVTPVFVPPTSLSPPCSHLLPLKNFNAVPHSNIELQFILTYAEIVNYVFYFFFFISIILSPSLNTNIDILSTRIRLFAYIILYFIFHSDVRMFISLFFIFPLFSIFLFLSFFVRYFFFCHIHIHTHTCARTHTHYFSQHRIHFLFRYLIFFIIRILFHLREKYYFRLF